MRNIFAIIGMLVFCTTIHAECDQTQKTGCLKAKQSHMGDVGDCYESSGCPKPDATENTNQKPQ